MTNSIRPNDLGRSLVKFFQDYLPTLRGMSPHTVRSYRDALVLLLRYLGAQRKCSVDRLDLSTITAASITKFLMDLETERHNGIGTRNSRLSAIHTFAKYLAAEHPERLGQLQAILGIPFKRGARTEPIEYLEQREVEALLAGIDRSTSPGRRDYALFALMFNTGARVQEILDLRICDLRLCSPCQVRLLGKGSRVRVCPVWAHTAELLKKLVSERTDNLDQNAPLFVNSHGSKLTRFGVRYLLRKHIATAAERIPSIAEKRVHPHSIRHTTAIHLLKAGVDFATISQWLGHASLDTTMRYARADIDMKRQALLQVFPDVLAPSGTDLKSFSRLPIIEWMRRL